MKRASSFVCALALALTLCAPTAHAAQPVNYALYTDIVATINGHPIRSYNIGGYTAVVAEDLRGYGFHVIWNASERTLRIFRATSDGVLQTPEVWPDYTPQPLGGRIGSRAKAVYATDIVTYAASERVDSININGETLVWIEHLDAFGSVVWDAETRVIALTLGDPVAIAIEPLIASVEDWRDTAGPSSTWETWECPTGTLLYTRYTGTPHGSNEGLLFVRKNGEKLRISGLLPTYGIWWSFGNHFHPREITLDEAGHLLTFVTPLPNETGEPTDTLCTVNLNAGVLLSLQPLSASLTDWQVSWTSAQTSRDALHLTVQREGAAVRATGGTAPDAVAVDLGTDGLRVIHYASLLFDENGGGYRKAYDALRALGLPDVMSGGELSNTPEQRAAAAQYFSLMWNGEAVPGALWWSQGNNHVDLNFTPDTPLYLRDGDTLTLSIRSE